MPASSEIQHKKHMLPFRAALATSEEDPAFCNDELASAAAASIAWTSPVSDEGMATPDVATAGVPDDEGIAARKGETTASAGSGDSAAGVALTAGDAGHGWRRAQHAKATMLGLGRGGARRLGREALQ